MDEVIKMASTNCICDQCQFGEVSYWWQFLNRSVSGTDNRRSHCGQVSHAVMPLRVSCCHVTKCLMLSCHSGVSCCHVTKCLMLSCHMTYWCVDAHMYVCVCFHPPRRLQDTAWWKSRTTEARLEYKSTPLDAF